VRFEGCRDMDVDMRCERWRWQGELDKMYLEIGRDPTNQIQRVEHFDFMVDGPPSSPLTSISCNICCALPFYHDGRAGYFFRGVHEWRSRRAWHSTSGRSDFSLGRRFLVLHLLRCKILALGVGMLFLWLIEVEDTQYP